MGQSFLGLFHDLVPPNEQFPAEIIPLPLIHEGLFVKRLVAPILVQYCLAVLMRRHCNPLQNEASPNSRAGLYRAARCADNTELWRFWFSVQCKRTAPDETRICASRRALHWNSP